MSETINISSITQGSDEDLEALLRVNKVSLRSHKDITSNTLLHLSLQNDRASLIKRLLHHVLRI